MPELYIGLMSGTSMDGIDAVLVDLETQRPELISHHQHSWPDKLLQRIKNAAAGEPLSASAFAQLDSALGAEFAAAANQVTLKAQINSSQVVAIGSHGQTLAHTPDSDEASSMQLGDPNQISERTGITTVADFRRRDIAAGGQGAPLVPAFHAHLFGRKQTRVILNIGGIANITLLPGENNKIPVSGFDTGPGNCLMDTWCRKNGHGNYDMAGHWASEGLVVQEWLKQLLQDEYFSQPPPKSTGTQYFSQQWLGKHLAHSSLTAANTQASLAELTVTTIADAIRRWGKGSEEVIVCGGGVHNSHLLKRLGTHLTVPINSSAKYGVDPDWMEAIAFAWLARQTINQKPGNLPDATGSRGPRVLGGIYYR